MQYCTNNTVVTTLNVGVGTVRYGTVRYVTGNRSFPFDGYGASRNDGRR